MSTALSAALCVLALLATPLCRSYSAASPAPPVLTHQQDEDDTLDEPISEAAALARLEHLILDQSDKLLDEAQRDFLLRRFLSSLPTPQQQQVQLQSQLLQQPQPMLGGKHNLFASEIEPLDDKEKRGSYMSLCHFKICNMGRKRNLRTVNPWIRQ